MKASYIMTYSKTSECRERNLLIILEWLTKNFPEIEIILAESDTVSKISEEMKSYGVKSIFYKSNDIFNRGKMRNIGALNASSDILIFADSDVIMEPVLFKTCLKECITHVQAVNPFCECYDLTEEDLVEMNIKENGLSPFYKLPKRVDSEETIVRSDLNFCGGSFIIRKKEFFYLGGWPEDLIGWGGEDDIISYKIDKFLTRKNYNHYIYHLPHERSIYDWYDHPEFDNNCKKMNEVLSYSDEELIKYCEKQREQLLKSDCPYLTESEKHEMIHFQLTNPRKLSGMGLDNSLKSCYPLILDE